MTEWHEDETFWDRGRSIVFGQRVMAGAPDEVENIVRLFGIEPPARILDMPCGPGRHALELARRGFLVTGVDRTAKYLDEAAAGAKARGLADRTAWVRADMREFGRDGRTGADQAGTFDAAINVFTSFGYFARPEDDRRVAEAFFAALRPGGHILFEMVNKGWISRRFQASDWHEEPDGTLLLEQRTLSADGSWIDNRWIVVRGGERSELRFGHRLYGEEELRAVLASVGFTGMRVYGALSGMDATPESPRLVMVARKPGS